MLKKFVVATVISAMVFMSFGVFAEDVAPDELIRKNTADVLAMLKSDKDLAAGDPVKIDKLANEKILPYFNFQRMTQLAVGRGWRDTTDVQKTALINEFRRLLVRTYSSSLSQFRNQTIDVRSLKLVPTDAEIVVKTVVNQPGGQGIPIDYAMEKTKDGWKVFDVMIDGVSLVTNYRSSFSTEIKNGGVDGLIKSLADRNAKNAAKK